MNIIEALGKIQSCLSKLNKDFDKDNEKILFVTLDGKFEGWLAEFDPSKEYNNDDVLYIKTKKDLIFMPCNRICYVALSGESQIGFLSRGSKEA